jgi:hypothetical protein
MNTEEPRISAAIPAKGGEKCTICNDYGGVIVNGICDPKTGEAIWETCECRFQQED